MPAAAVNGLSIFWRETGSGHPVVLLMGMETDHRGWARLVPQLKEHFRCISLDNRDVGQSGQAQSPYEIGAMANDTIGLINLLGLNKVSLIGQSMGGAIAQEVARRHPERVDRMVLISSFSTLDERSRQSLRNWKVVRKSLSLREYYSLVFPWMYTNSEYGTPGFIDEILDRAAANLSPQPYAAFCRHVDAVLGFNSRPWLHELPVKTLIVSGQEDLITPPSNAAELASKIRGSGLLLVEQAGHGLALTSAIDPISYDIRRFLS